MSPQLNDSNSASETASLDGKSSQIVDVKNPAISRVLDVMRSKTTRPRTVIIDDAENIRQAFACGVKIEAIYRGPDSDFHLDTGVESNPIAEFIVAETVMKTLFKGDKRTHVFALARAPKLANWGDVSKGSGDVLVLDGVRIAGNIGAITRSAAAFGASAVVLLDSELISIFDRRLIRASRGLVFQIPLLTATPTGLLEFLHSQNIRLAVLTADGTEPLSGLGEVPERIALLVGSEREGASSVLEQAASWRCSVPMDSAVESLNVSVAAGIALYERRRV